MFVYFIVTFLDKCNVDKLRIWILDISYELHTKKFSEILSWIKFFMCLEYALFWSILFCFVLALFWFILHFCDFWFFVHLFWIFFRGIILLLISRKRYLLFGKKGTSFLFFQNLKVQSLTVLSCQFFNFKLIRIYQAYRGTD